MFWRRNDYQITLQIHQQEQYHNTIIVYLKLHFGEHSYSIIITNKYSKIHHQLQLVSASWKYINLVWNVRLQLWFSGRGSICTNNILELILFTRDRRGHFGVNEDVSSPRPCTRSSNENQSHL